MMRISILALKGHNKSAQGIALGTLLHQGGVTAG
jgi:hypothetical protein